MHSQSLSQLIAEFVSQEQLPPEYGEDAQRWFLPLAAELYRRQENLDRPLLVAINGTQGTGKSTLAALLTRLLENQELRVANLSIDDFYLSHDRRRELARDIHPLFASRGVPGTHDTELLARCLDALCEADAGQQLALPRFDKSRDDCVARADWPRIAGPVQVIILEGWFVGLRPQSADALSDPVNALERDEDPDAIWRQRVNHALANDYQKIFERFDYLIMLQAPSFDQVYEWRSLQEQKLRQRSTADAVGVMNEEQLKRFIQHFERLTRHCLDTLPDQADCVFSLNGAHRVSACRQR